MAVLRLALALSVALLSVPVHPAAPTSAPAELRAVWASTLQPCMNSPAEIRDMVAAVRRSHLNTIIAQVRHRGVTFYDSKFEPRAPAIRNTPAFDPLATLLREAHETSGGRQQRIAVQAWFNVFRLGSMETGDSASAAKPAGRYRDWLSETTTGSQVEFLDPAIPEVQDLLIQMVEECVSRYDVDGVNLDYIRYPEEEAGYHPRAIERFRKWAGDPNAKPEPKDPRWNDFRREQITNFVRRCAVTVWNRRPDALLTVNGIGFGGPPAGGDFTKSSPYVQVKQDWAGWARDGWVDIVTRMGYKRESVPAHARMFREWADLSVRVQREANGPLVTLGIGGGFNTGAEVIAQHREAQNRSLGTSLFSYWRPDSESAKSRQFGSASPLWDRLAKEVFPGPSTPPPPEWRRGICVVAGTALDATGKPADGALVQLETAGQTVRTRTDGSGFFAFSRVKPGDCTVRAAGTVADGSRVHAVAGRVVFVNGKSR